MEGFRQAMATAEENISLIRERQARIEQKIDDGFKHIADKFDGLCCKEHEKEVKNIKSEWGLWKGGVSVLTIIFSGFVAWVGGHLK
jgi:hypothetical protein